MNIIETNQLSRRYWRTEALRSLTLAVPVGSVFALLGANGAGKTTAIKVLMNLLPPSAGEARVLGVDSRRLGPAQRAQIDRVLKLSGGNKTEAARLLGISRRSLYRWIDRLAVEQPRKQA